MGCHYHSTSTLIVLFICVGYFSSSSSFTAALPRNTSMVVPGGSKPWYCCHLSAWLKRASKREGGTTDTSPDKAENVGKMEIMIYVAATRSMLYLYVIKAKSSYKESPFSKAENYIHLVEVKCGMLALLFRTQIHNSTIKAFLVQNCWSIKPKSDGSTV